MIIKTLVENTSVIDECKSEHGLSLYIETNTHKLLFDLGKSDLFLENAKKLNVNISDVDIVIISHGHYDHGGGLGAFLKVNAKAKVYVHIKAFEKHYSMQADGTTSYIGLDEELKNSDRLIFVDDCFKIDDELELFSNVTGNELPSLSNKVLLMSAGDVITEDTFEHEQNLIITELGRSVLIAGCAHKGIVNIMNHAMKINKKPINFVIGGFHLFNPNTKISESPDLIEQIGKRLKETQSMYYTCHCTGSLPYLT
jgi:7,8-dihydropterin-6-yl-methyl-4-(beta-D-ribofuranosyl)aminobenzene 5'-phosphate synthase